MQKLFLCLLGIVFFSQTLFASGSIADHAPDRATAEILTYLEELSQIPRPSGQEAAAFQWLMQKHWQAEDLWGGRRLGLSVGTDPKKGLYQIIGLPGTGQFAKRKSPQIIAIQGHMDRVVDGDETPKLVVNNEGWIHSKDFHASIGADNGVAIAIMVYLMMHPEIEHPPLELIFTSREEEGLTGAKNFTWPLDASVLLSLDGEKSEALYRASMGSQREVFSAEFPAENRNDYSKLYTISLSNLPSGHSGADVHLNSPPTVSILSSLLRELPVESLVTEISMGSPTDLNKLPSSFEIQVVFPEGLNPEEVKKTLQLKMESVLNSRQKEQSQLELTKSIAPDDLELIETNKDLSFSAIPIADLFPLCDLLDQSPVGVLDTRADLPKSGLSSASIGFLLLETPPVEVPFARKNKAEKPVLKLQVATMIRSFDSKRLNYWVVQQNKVARRSGFPFTREIINSSPNWLEDLDSWLIQLAKQRIPKLRLESAAGGVEVPYLLSRMVPESKAALLLGADITGAHSRKESTRIQSISELQKNVEALLISIGNSKQFKKKTSQTCRGVLSGLLNRR